MLLFIIRIIFGNSLITTLFTIFLGAGGIFGWFELQKHEAYMQGQEDFNKKQIALLEQEKKEFEIKLEELSKQEAIIVQENRRLNSVINNNTEKTVKWIRVQKSNGLDPIFNKTLKRMKGIK